MGCGDIAVRTAMYMDDSYFDGDDGEDYNEYRRQLF